MTSDSRVQGPQRTAKHDDFDALDRVADVAVRRGSPQRPEEDHAQDRRAQRQADREGRDGGVRPALVDDSACLDPG